MNEHLPNIVNNKKHMTEYRKHLDNEYDIGLLRNRWLAINGVTYYN